MLAKATRTMKNALERRSDESGVGKLEKTATARRMAVRGG